MHKYFFLLLISIFLSAASPQQTQPVSSCSAAYGGSMPDPLPAWLQTEMPVTDLATQNRYDLLAGELLKNGIVDGSNCPAGGLYPDGSPNGCGVDTAMPAVMEWQNRYDTAILVSGQTSIVPPALMKAVIAAESQFWPGPNWAKGEIGLGQMTGFGADLLLSYRPGYYRQVCSQALNNEECSKDYSSLSDANRAMLRGLVLKSLDATCASCPGGIDPLKGEVAVSVLAETMAASCTQAGRVFRLATGKPPASLLSYEDFWRFTLANYHSGAGCMFQSLRSVGNPTSWPAITAGMLEGCKSGAWYVRRIEENIRP